MGSNTLFPMLSFMMLALKAYSQSTSFQINAFTNTSLKVTYERDAFVLPDETYVRLTGADASGNPRYSSVGRVLYNKPVELWEKGKQASFDTNITLQLTQAPSPSRTGHGMTFFIIPVNSTINTGGVGHNLGIFDAVVPGSPIFAVEIDIGGYGNDPHEDHIGININSRESQNYTKIRNSIRGSHVTMRITYDVPTRMISVVVTYELYTLRVSYAYNLGILLPKQVQVGLSASTGATLASFFDAYTWHFNSTMGPDIDKEDDAYIKKYVM